MDKPPKSRGSETALTIAEAAVSAIPLVGGSLAVLSELLRRTLSRRREQWLDLLAHAVSELEERVSELSEPLGQNENFATAVQHATEIAMRTHREEKLHALQNAVRNSALKAVPDEDSQVMFLRFIDELSASHLLVLAVLDDPVGSVMRSGRQMHVSGGLHLVIYHCIPVLNRKGQFLEQLCKDLESRGLIVQSSSSIYTARTSYPSLTSDFGKQFLTFIT
jgi:hypothetical protein